MSAREVARENVLCSFGISGLCVERCTGHVSYHSVATLHSVLCGSKGVVLRRRLREPDITAVTVKMAALERRLNIFRYDDCATCGVDKVGACSRLAENLRELPELTLLHLGDEILIEQASCLLVEWAVDGDNVALSQHLLEIVNSSAANLLLDFRLQWLVIEVEQFFAVEGLQSAEHTFANAANSDCSNDLVF